jgi:DNA polymerase-3 subunit delta
VVFVVRDQPDGRKKMSVELKKWAAPVTFPYLNDPDIAKWANQALKPLNKRIGPEAVARLTFMAGRSLTQLSAEIEKLAAYSGGRDEIVADDVNAMVSPSPEFTVFQMIDSVLEKNPLRARQLLKSLLEGGEDRVGVLALLTRQMRMMTHLRLMRARGDSLGEAARALSLNSYAAELAARHAARFTAESLAEGYRACVEADFAIKSGRLRDEAALDSVMMALDRLV